MKKGRLLWIDNIRGVAVLLVILSHSTDTAPFERALLSLFMIPSFFFISGYLTKYEGTNPGQYFYNRILKLLLVYIVYGFLIPFTSISEVKMMIHQPGLIIDALKNALISTVCGRCLWFVACLIVVNVIFMMIKTIAKERYIVLAVISTTLAGIGFFIARTTVGTMTYWSADTALVGQWFFVMGYLLKRYEKPEWYVHPLPKAAVTGAAYVALVVFAGIKIGFPYVAINAALNRWGILWITLPIIFIGLISALFSSRLLNHVKLLPYFGANSLVYFAFGSHGMSVMNKVFTLLYDKTGIAVLTNRAVINPVIAFTGAILLIPLCWLINRYIPFLNGHYKLPKLKRGKCSSS